MCGKYGRDGAMKNPWLGRLEPDPYPWTRPKMEDEMPCDNGKAQEPGVFGLEEALRHVRDGRRVQSRSHRGGMWIESSLNNREERYSVDALMIIATTCEFRLEPQPTPAERAAEAAYPVANRGDLRQAFVRGYTMGVLAMEEKLRCCAPTSAVRELLGGAK